MDKPQGRFIRNASSIDRMTYSHAITHTAHQIGSLFGVKVKELIVNQQVNTFRTMLIKLFFPLLEYKKKKPLKNYIKRKSLSMNSDVSAPRERF